MSRRRSCAVLGVASSMLLAGCSAASSAEPSRFNDTVDVVATTPIMADLARNVAGDQAHVTQLMPNGADPHSFEPTLRSVRDIANADLALTNGLLLEPQSLTKTMTATVPAGTPVIDVADDISKYGGEHIALVENIALDTVWLGMRVVGYGAGYGGSSQSEVHVLVDDIRGPGTATAYVTGTFGTPEVYFNSADGIDENDVAVLPTNAHTHVSWAFSQPGVYELDIVGELHPGGADPVRMGQSTITVAVGVDPATAAPGMHPIDSGHVDVAVDLDQSRVTLVGDAPEGDDTRHVYDPAQSVIVVPTSTLQEIPGDPAFRFLGTAGTETYLLPQAVLGKHVHGEVDPHVWHSVPNAQAMVQVIRDALISVDPAGATTYHANAERYLAELAELDTELHAAVEQIPEANRNLVTTHHGYAYLDQAYGLDVAGFVTPNPDIEPSPRDLIALTRTLENLHVPAVFIEPALATRETELSLTADRLGIATCPIYGDTFDPDGPVSSYIDMMRANAESLTRCLGH